MSTADINEQLSALVDDELRKEEASLLIRRLSQSPEHRAQLARYFLASDVLRGAVPARGRVDLSARVAAAIEREQALPARRRPRVLKPLAGLAVAASVSAVSIGLWSQQAELPASAAGASAIAQVPGSGASEPQQWERLHPSIQRRLNGYVINHSEASAGQPIGGVFNYVRLAGQQSDAE